MTRNIADASAIQDRDSTPEYTKHQCVPPTLASDSGKPAMTRPRPSKSTASKPTPARRRRRVHSRQQNPTPSTTPKNTPTPKRTHREARPLAPAPRVDTALTPKFCSLNTLRFPFATPLRRAFIFICALTTLVVAYAINSEITTSNLQSQYLAEFGKKLYFWTEPTPNPDLQFPIVGPYDQRLGYTHIPTAIDKLSANNYHITTQAQHSPTLETILSRGIYAPYAEKNYAGLNILDRNNQSIYQTRFPEHGFASFDEIPNLVVQTLLFIENRDLLDDANPNHNPAISWKRFAGASLAMSARKLGATGNVHGGSTLATQLEKFRHTDRGLTQTGHDKLTQMTSASIRAYLDGPDTSQTRQKIVLDYLNGVPLAAVNGHGEVHGLLDGLRAWFDSDPQQLMNAFNADRAMISATAKPYIDQNLLQQQADAYRKVLSLMLAHRRPSYFLVQNPAALHDLTDQYLRVLAQANVISETLRDAALLTRVDVKRSVPEPPPTSFVERKAVDRIRTHMLQTLDLKGLYDLDRFDLTVKTTIDATAQKDVSQTLGKLNDPIFASTLGLLQEGQRMLSPTSDLSQLVYSFTLYESTPAGNLLRVQADSFDQPLNINEQVKLDLGSTAKLRTLVTYLEIIAELHTRFSTLSIDELNHHAEKSQDALTRWTASYFSKQPEDKSLQATLDAAMNRYYSGSPSERFFTGGGVHKFSNFNNRRNHVMTVHEAFQHSVNLPFIRMMRDIALYYTYLDPKRVHDILNDPHNPERRILLERFAEQEGRTFQERYIRKYRGKSKDEILQTLSKSREFTPRQLAVAYRAVAPENDFDTFATYIKKHVKQSTTDPQLADLYQTHAPGSFNLSDQAYLARIHPLEIWTAHYLRQNPDATHQQIIDNSRTTRQEIYSWLFRTNRKNQQDKRIKILLEEDAFTHVHHAWKRLGYPFDSLVPSYATAIGSSADRPAALAELIGIIQNDGLRLPTRSVTEYEFAKNTPFETTLTLTDPKPERVLAPEVARTARKALREVVQHGTARRVDKSFVTHDGQILEVGGKTGTGDHRVKRYSTGPGPKRLLETRSINRTATFAFAISDRFYGTLTVFVPGEDSANFHFTSALPAQLLSALAPALMPIIDPQTPTPAITPENIDNALLVAQNLVSTSQTTATPPPTIQPGFPTWNNLFAANLNSAPTDYSPTDYVLEPAPQAPPSTQSPLPSWSEIFGNQPQNQNHHPPILTNTHI